jgi:adenosylcobinamide kinase / adenosylcobinamide-phosphate guanylyltransferase
VTARLVLVLGGTRSGKSRFGLRRAREIANEAPVTYLATARPGDPELDDRIRRHRADRPADWPTIDVGIDLAADVRRVPPDATILLDGLTLWLSAVAGNDPADVDGILDGPFTAAVDAFRERPGPVVVVSDELGLGMVPLDPVARAFRDLQGIAHQRLAGEADEVHLLVAGIPLTLRDR